MEKRAFKVELYGHLSRIGRALANGHRVEILELLAQCPRTVDSVAKELDLSLANTSSHLQVLKAARLVEGKKDGSFVYYRLADDSVFALLDSVRTVAERRLDEVDKLVRTYLADRDELEPISLNELRTRLKTGDVLLVDVRPAAEYEAGHIPGARSIPYDEVETRLRELPKNREIVAYCRGPYCVYADEVVALLNKRQRKARRLVAGWPQWKAAGFPVGRGPIARRGAST